MGNLKASIASGVLATIVAVGNVNAEEQKQIEKQDNKSQIVQVVNKNKTQTNEIIQANLVVSNGENVKIQQTSLRTLSPEEHSKLGEQKEKAFEEALKVDTRTLEFPKDVDKLNNLLEIFEIDYKINPERKPTFIIASKKVSNFQGEVRIKKLDVDIAKIQAKTAEIGEKIAKLKEERAIIQEEGKKYAERNKKLDEDIVAIRARNAELKKVYEQLSNNGNREIIALKK